MMARRMRPAIDYDPRRPVSREEWLSKWADLRRQREYPRRRPADAGTFKTASRGKSQMFRGEVV